MRKFECLNNQRFDFWTSCWFVLFICCCLLVPDKIFGNARYECGIRICPQESIANTKTNSRLLSSQKQESTASKKTASSGEETKKQKKETYPKASTNWPSWRGPLGTGEAVGGKPPIVWSEKENIRWKVTLPGKGHSTPIIWGNNVFVTSAAPTGKKFQPIADRRPGSHDNLKVSSQFQFIVTCFDKKTGKEKWSTVCETRIPHEGGHRSASLASASPVTDGRLVYAFFGSAGLYALDFKGKIVWEKAFPKMHSKHGHGEGASPTIWKDTLFVNWDEEGESFVVAINTTNGTERWRRPRRESTSWSSPIVAEIENKAQLIVAGTNFTRGYDVKTGKTIWSCSGLSANIVATPVVDGNILVVGSSYDIRSLMAIDLAGAKGDITHSKHILWKTNQKTPYIPSPLIYKGMVFYLRHYQGVLSVADLKSGESKSGPFRISGIWEVYSSPSAANNYVYVTSRSGLTVVISAIDFLQQKRTNVLNDKISASFAFSGDMILIRGEKYLYCVQDEKASREGRPAQ